MTLGRSELLWLAIFVTVAVGLLWRGRTPREAVWDRVIRDAPWTYCFVTYAAMHLCWSIGTDIGAPRFRLEGIVFKSQPVLESYLFPFLIVLPAIISNLLARRPVKA